MDNSHFTQWTDFQGTGAEAPVLNLYQIELEARQLRAEMVREYSANLLAWFKGFRLPVVFLNRKLG